MSTIRDPSGLVDADRCLEILFPDKKSRPSKRWFWKLKARGRIPHKKIGHLTFYDPGEVRRAIDHNYTVEAAE
jgi:hypothetical protein